MPSIKNSQRTVQLLVSRDRRGPAVSVLPNVIYLNFARCVCVCVCVWKTSNSYNYNVRYWYACRFVTACVRGAKFNNALLGSMSISHKAVPNIIFKPVTLNYFKVIYSVHFESPFSSKYQLNSPTICDYVTLLRHVST